MNRYSLSIICTLLLSLICAWSAIAEVEWQVQKTLTLEKKPLDMVTSVQGSWLLVLTDDGIVHIYNSAGVLKDQIEVGKHVDSIAAGPEENIFIVKSKKEKTVQRISFEFIREINVTGSPYKGNADAPVVIAVFSDYQ
jgi:hypothetical protein